MWFKQVTILKLTQSISSSSTTLSEHLEKFAFKPCLPSMAQSLGWVSPLNEDEPEPEAEEESTATLALAASHCLLFSLQIEEKILPASVVNHALKEKVKKIEATEARKLRQKEKLNLKDEIIFTFLQRAFSKFTLVFAYIDTVNQWLVINTSSPIRKEQFLTLFKKTFGDIVVDLDIMTPSLLLTHWLKEKKYPSSFAIEKTCVLQDPKQQNRIIRAQQQDLFSASIQALVKDGCDVMQIALCWQDRLRFVVASDFSLRSIQLADDDIIELPEEMATKRQQLTADLVIMTTMYAELFHDLIEVFLTKKKLAATG